MRKLIVAVAIMSVVGSLSASHAAVQTVLTLPGARLSGNFDGADVAVKSQTLTFANLDPLDEHNMRSVDNGPDGAPWCTGYPHGTCPLFISKFAHFGETATVDLRNTVAGGTYDFVCSAHSSMKGTLRVVA